MMQIHWIHLIDFSYTELCANMIWWFVVLHSFTRESRQSHVKDEAKTCDEDLKAWIEGSHWTCKCKLKSPLFHVSNSIVVWTVKKNPCGLIHITRVHSTGAHEWHTGDRCSTVQGAWSVHIGAKPWRRKTWNVSPFSSVSVSFFFFFEIACSELRQWFVLNPKPQRCGTFWHDFSILQFCISRCRQSKWRKWLWKVAV